MQTRYIGDIETGTIGRRPSGARLYHRGSRFGAPERRRIDRKARLRIFYLAIELERRTRGPRMKGGVFKHIGIEVLRALLFKFLNMKTGECWPSFEKLAHEARCSVERVRQAIRALELWGIIETTRRKMVQTYSSRVLRVSYDLAVQTSNSYVFNFPLPDRPTEGDLALPLLVPDTTNRHETNQPEKNKLPPVLAAALAGVRTMLDEMDRAAGEAEIASEEAAAGAEALRRTGER